MNRTHYSQGWTLVELMIVVAIVGMLATIAIPSYNSYIETSRMGAAKHNAVTLAGFEDTYFYENDKYLAGTYTPGGTNGLAALEWEPSGDDIYKYEVTAGTCTGGISECYTLTVTLVADTSISQTISRP